MNGRQRPVLVAGAGPGQADRLYQALERSVIGVAPVGVHQLATEIRRWRPGVVVLYPGCDVSPSEAAELAEAMRVIIISARMAVDGVGELADAIRRASVEPVGVRRG
ncbi:hypothetical protein ACQP2F_32630 [Actinoplanes sp. CA-030573]|uniref:hypothetical protein n=1 Tax=Actinoplanes sp. CA-030573 TaxID=3239898 RepID=UPI003D92AFC0